ncbi:hypothetical protein MAR_024222 [Mya arenaria]|uniref:Uncharacterized protein n=1 Tax=Mya arenaria TaxID=6604 RepID=A0ABY7DR01_MYAAR|nr:hypothetical protein MAR_024222 [Mya arenaria]
MSLQHSFAPGCHSNTYLPLDVTPTYVHFTPLNFYCDTYSSLPMPDILNPPKGHTDHTDPALIPCVKVMAVLMSLVKQAAASP